MNQENQTHDKLQKTVNTGINHIKNKIVPDYGTKIVFALIIIVIALFAFITIESNKTSQLKEDREVLGQVLYFLNQQKKDTAEVLLKEMYEQKDLNETIRAKGALLYGNILFEKGEYASAIEKFTYAAQNGADQTLITSAAEHGIAASYMQQKEYAKAVDALTAYVKKYARKTSAQPQVGTAVPETDLVVDIADALWKLALCQKELNQVDAAKTSLTRIISLYSENMNITAKAKSLLATL